MTIYSTLSGLVNFPDSIGADGIEHLDDSDRLERVKPDHESSVSSDDLLRELYEELRLLASQKMARESGPMTLQPTALVHEAYLRVAGGESGKRWDGRQHFLGAAAEAMRRILIEVARRKAADKRGNRAHHEELDDNLALPMPPDEFLAVAEALEELRAIDEESARIVDLLFFGGMTIDETSALVGLSTATVKRRWAHARSWLYLEIQEKCGVTSSS